ncbi:MAG: hypothetical protein JSS02_00950 [Planctomycetes bacterium]|nr:hypothetical protein [Planctomycetota bacterium]
MSIADAGWQDSDFEAIVPLLNELPSLQSLDASHNPLSDAALVSLGRVPRLLDVHISHTSVSLHDAEVVGQLQQVVRLSLVGCKIDQESFLNLRDMQGLRIVFVSTQAVSASVLEELQRVRPTLQIYEADWP